jgi:hypothetical protein
MRLTVHTHKEFIIHFGVHLSGAYRGMAEQFLHDPQVGTVHEHVSCAGVTQSVGRDIVFDARQ